MPSAAKRHGVFLMPRKLTIATQSLFVSGSVDYAEVIWQTYKDRPYSLPCLRLAIVQHHARHIATAEYIHQHVALSRT